MNTDKANIVTLVLEVITILFFLARRFGNLANNVKIFLSLRASLMAGFFWALVRRIGKTRASFHEPR